MNRNPAANSVSIKIGLSAESPSASRAADRRVQTVVEINKRILGQSFPQLFPRYQIARELPAAPTDLSGLVL